MLKRFGSFCVYCFCLLSLGLTAAHAKDVFIDEDKAMVKLGEKEVWLDVADTPQLRHVGLKFVRQMCDDCGLLFKFEEIKQRYFTMQNTRLPLDIAFIDENGHIISIKPMMPQDATIIASDQPIKYAIEMHQGWFAQHNIGVETLVRIHTPSPDDYQGLAEKE